MKDKDTKLLEEAYVQINEKDLSFSDLEKMASQGKFEGTQKSLLKLVNHYKSQLSPEEKDSWSMPYLDWKTSSYDFEPERYPPVDAVFIKQLENLKNTFKKCELHSEGIVDIMDYPEEYESYIIDIKKTIGKLSNGVFDIDLLIKRIKETNKGL